MEAEVDVMETVIKRPVPDDMHSSSGTTSILAQLSAQDRHELAKAVDILKQQGATAVYLFGSMATGTATEISDWDIAIEGLPSSAFLPALVKLTSALRRPVDLVELDDGSRFATYLRTWGSLLYVA